MAFIIRPDQRPESRLLEVECITRVLRELIIRSKPITAAEMDEAIGHLISQLVATRTEYSERAANRALAEALEVSL